MKRICGHMSALGASNNGLLTGKVIAMYGGIVGPPAVAGGVLALTGFSTGGYVLTALALVIAGAFFLRHKTIKQKAAALDES